MGELGRRNPAALACTLCVAGILTFGAARAQADWRSAPAVPKLGPAISKAAVRTVVRGRRLGNRLDVFAKVGDSISQSPAFLQPLGCERSRLGRHSGLQSTIRYFKTRTLPGVSGFCRRSNSISRASAATLAFTPTAWALTPGASPHPACGSDETPLACEIRLDRPAYAVVLFGTNDVTIALQFGGDPLNAFVLNMREIVLTARRLGVVPILTTVPPRTDNAEAELATEDLNAGLYRLAADLNAPLINLWRALDGLPNHGVSADRLHPSLFGGPGCVGLCNPAICAPTCQAGNFSHKALLYGYNRRNLITLATLARLHALVREHLGKRDGRHRHH